MKILWVDDDPEYTEGILRKFKKAGYQIINALDKKTAVEILKKEQDFRFLLLDVIIPNDYNASVKSSDTDKSSNYLTVVISLLDELTKMGISLPVVVFSVVNEKNILDIIEKTYNRILIIPKSIKTSGEFYDQVISYLDSGV